MSAKTSVKGKHIAQTTFKGRNCFAAMAQELQRADKRAADDLRRSAPLRHKKG